MKHELIAKQAEAQLIESKAIQANLEDRFGATIPVDETVSVSAANLAFMNEIVAEYAQLKLSLVKMMDLKTIKAGELTLEGVHADIFKFGMSTALELVGSPCVE
ncbi:hypothetical protein [Psychromonas sp. MME2]|uniref:hypothetical protein n=1 Tax=unclassified Psychromonas TaxID=2614957 RepID=UPI00339CD33E